VVAVTAPSTFPSGAPVSLKDSRSDARGETALHVIALLSGWRSLSAKTRVNLA